MKICHCQTQICAGGIKKKKEEEKKKSEKKKSDESIRHRVLRTGCLINNNNNDDQFVYRLLSCFLPLLYALTNRLDTVAVVIVYEIL